MQKIKTGDNVVITAGKDKGKQGKVLRLLKRKAKNGRVASNPKGELKVVVEGANMIKKHVRGNPNQGVQGGIISKEAPLHISNIALVNPKTNKAEKVGFKTLEDGRKVRIFKLSGEVVDV